MSFQIVTRILVLAVLACGLLQAGEGRRIDSIPTVSYQIEGLSGPAEILIDPWGVPHIYASDQYDAFFVQGFNAARDRLWQLDLWRRRGLGLLSEVFGEEYLEKDRASRLFLYRKDMYSEWLFYGSDAKRIATSFVGGVNAYIGLTREHADLLPWEFEFLGYRPSEWDPADVVRIRSHGLVRNVRSEVNRALFVARFGLDADRLRRHLEPDWKTAVPEGIDLGSIPEDVLDVYTLATRGVQFQPTEESALAEPRGVPAERRADEERQFFDETGSNNWALSPRLTATGRPILANDPHRRQSIPSLRYVAHLVAPGLNVIGAGEPGLPGVSIGHNERIAFGLTIFSIDQEDLYVYRTNPENSLEYWYKDHWERMEIVSEKIPVKGRAPEKVELKFTRHGPVIAEKKDQGTAFAVRAAWLEPGMAPYFGSVEYMRAGNWDEFLAAMNRWGAPAENQIFADVDGNIGWTPRGRAPIRPNWDGLLPVPGDGRYEWAGYYDQDQLPVEFNPGRGWVGSANSMNLPADYPYRDRKLGFEWATPWRMKRIDEVLSSTSKATLQDMLNLQNDRVYIPARHLVASLDDLDAQDPEVSQAVRLLKGWDGVMGNDSSAAALFHVWLRDDHLGKALLRRLVDPEVVEEIESPHEVVLLQIVERPENWFPSDPDKQLNAALEESLEAAFKSLQESQGRDPSAWRFGPFNIAEMKHPLSALLDDEKRLRTDIPPSERHAVRGPVASSNASWREIIDVGNWDNSLALSNPGQSGVPASPYYRNLWPRWLTGGAFPLLYSRELIESVAERRIVLDSREGKNGRGETN